MVEGDLRDLHGGMKIIVRANIFFHLHCTFEFAKSCENRRYAGCYQCATEHDGSRSIGLLAGNLIQYTVEICGMLFPLAVGQSDFRGRLLEEQEHIEHLAAKPFVEADVIFLSFDGSCRTIFPVGFAGVGGAGYTLRRLWNV